MTCNRLRGLNGVICVAGDYKLGDPKPNGYLEEYEWVEVQLKAGLKQTVCLLCAKWKFPQEFSEQTQMFSYSRTKHGPKIIEMRRICKDCAKVK